MTGAGAFVGAGAGETNAYGQTTWGGYLSDSGETRSGSAVFDSSSIDLLGIYKNNFTNNKILYILAKRGATELGKATISLENFDYTVPSITASSYTVGSSYNVVTINSTDSESGIKEVRYEYVTKYKTSGNVNYYGSTTIDEAYLLTFSKTGDLQFKIPKNVAKLRYIVLDNAGNYTTIQELTISDGLQEL